MMQKLTANLAKLESTEMLKARQSAYLVLSESIRTTYGAHPAKLAVLGGSPHQFKAIPSLIARHVLQAERTIIRYTPSRTVPSARLENIKIRPHKQAVKTASLESMLARKEATKHLTANLAQWGSSRAVQGKQAAKTARKESTLMKKSKPPASPVLWGSTLTSWDRLAARAVALENIQTVQGARLCLIVKIVVKGSIRAQEVSRAQRAQEEGTRTSFNRQAVNYVQ